MTGYQAAFGLAQTRRINSIIEDKRRVAHAYNRFLAGVPGLRLPPERPWARNVYWMYAVTVQGDGRRDALAKFLQDAGIETRTFFCPMNQQPFLRAQPGYRDIPCPVADRLWQTGLYLPSAPNLSEEKIGFIASKIRDFLTRA
jgi:perosamine synthetase